MGRGAAGGGSRMERKALQEMSISRDPPFYFDVSCDECSHGEERVEADDFYEVVGKIKEKGGRVRKSGTDWEHICPHCNGKNEFDDG